MKIGLIQMACGPSPKANLTRAASLVGQAAAKGARIVLLQELYRTEYFCKTEDPRNFDLAEPIPGPSTDFFCRLAKSGRIVLVAPLFEKRAKGIYHNTAVVIDADGKVLGKYRKMHIPDDPGFYEKFYFVPGDLGFKSFKTRYAEIGVLICWDQWFPEAARLSALSGAEILFYPTAIGWKTGRRREAESYRDAWETVQRGHAIASGVFVAAANRVGREGGFEYWGSSFVADPFGKIIRRASAVKEEALVVDCDLSQVEKIRREWPFLRDRRVDAYKGILSRSSE
ncbi:MAG: carbon-nitrogen hydrolase [Candidatus Omnitrophica bacterium]|nr:carbon-nitrogen hydrolase [Candidatus Omnitrophota bacterium]